MNTDKVKLPAFLASALINGDMSGIEPDEERWVAAALEYAAPGRYIDVGDSYFSWSCELPGWRLGAEMAEYTILYPTDPDEEIHVDDVLQSYLECALWSSIDESSESHLDRNYSIDDLTDEATDRAREDVNKFLAAADTAFRISHDEREEQGKKRSFDAGDIGHDFWLTRNGHGAGFWDRPEKYGKHLAAALTKISKQFGETHVYVTDDGELEFGG